MYKSIITALFAFVACSGIDLIDAASNHHLDVSSSPRLVPSLTAAARPTEKPAPAPLPAMDLITLSYESSAASNIGLTVTAGRADYKLASPFSG
jgi:hypothetical protein